MQNTFDSVYKEFMTEFQASGWYEISHANLQLIMETYLKGYTEQNEELFIEAQKILTDKILNILYNTDGPEGGLGIHLPIAYSYVCPLDELPPLLIGNHSVIEKDDVYTYCNGDVVSQNITNLFEKVKKNG